MILSSCQEYTSSNAQALVSQCSKRSLQHDDRPAKYIYSCIHNDDLSVILFHHLNFIFQPRNKLLTNTTLTPQKTPTCHRLIPTALSFPPRPAQMQASRAQVFSSHSSSRPAQHCFSPPSSSCEKPDTHLTNPRSHANCCSPSPINKCSPASPSSPSD